MLRRSHNEQVAKILSDPEASDNDKYVALTFLRNAEVAAKGVLPFCQDTGTAIIHGEKVSRYGPDIVMKKLYHLEFIRLILKKTCATHRMLLLLCMKRLILAATCLLRLISEATQEVWSSLDINLARW